MKISLQQLLVGLGCCWAFTQLPGCMPLAGPGQMPIWSPRQPIGIYNPTPFPGASPWYPVGNFPPPGTYPQFPGGPGVPVVVLPPSGPGTVPIDPGFPNPTQPDPDFPDPTGPPTIPVTTPIAAPTEPNEDSNDFWSPWPLPPRASQLALRDSNTGGAGLNGPRGFLPSGQHDVSRPQFGQFVSATDSENLKYRGGKVIRDLSYVNLYVSGDTEWSMSDVDRIDRSLAAAMNDQHLNNVLLQYFDNQNIRSKAFASHPLTGHTPALVTRGDVSRYLTYLHRQGFLRSFDLQNTVINLLLPPKTFLTSDASLADAQGSSRALEFEQSAADQDVDSREGLAGYHGSVVSTNGERIYFAVGVYSERFSNGDTNGVPVFGEPWKNVVATLYHQLIEVRTNPDVEDALRDSTDLDAGRILGWVSDAGLEIGDLPLRSSGPITNVIREVPLADDSGTVPIQLPYSNIAGGPEGPISRPHPLPSD